MTSSDRFARQLLDQRVTDVLQLVEHLGGLNAQTARGPSVGLWTRMAAFDQTDLDAHLRSYRLVKANLLRGTVHLVTARQYRAWRWALQPRLEEVVRQECRGLDDVAPRTVLVGAATELLAAHDGLSRAEVGRLLAPRFPGADPADLGFAARMLLPVVEVADDHLWAPGRTRYVLAASVLDGDLGPPEEGLADLLRSYLALYAPATTADASAFTGLAGLAGPLRDVGDVGPLPIGVPRAAVVLPEYDNVLFAHRDGPLVELRRRLITNTATVMPGAVFHRGRCVASWRRARDGELDVVPFDGPLPGPVAEEVERFRSWYAATEAATPRR